MHLTSNFCITLFNPYTLIANWQRFHGFMLANKWAIWGFTQSFTFYPVLPNYRG